MQRLAFNHSIMCVLVLRLDQVNDTTDFRVIGPLFCCTISLTVGILEIYWGTKVWNIDINFVVIKKQMRE